MDYLLDQPSRAISIITVAILLSALMIEVVVSILVKRKVYDGRDTLLNLTMYAGSLAINSLWLPVAYNVYEFVHRYSIFKLGSQWWLFRGDTPIWHWALLFVLDDLCFYCFHRASHASRLLWASHVTHHSSNEFNLSVGLRQTWLPFFAIVFWIPLAFIGFDPLMIMTMQLASLFLQALLHTRLVSSFGPFDRIFNSPSHHRVHHGSQERYIDKNFGGVLIIWDRLFGTFTPETEPVVFGIGNDRPSYNPLEVAFGEFLRWRPTKATAVLLAILLFAPGCHALVQDWQRERLLTHLERIENYHGIYSETGILDTKEPLVSEVWFQVPTSYSFVIKSPAKHAGSQMYYDGKRLQIFYPQTKFAIVYENLPPLTKEEAKKLMEDAFNENLATFDYELGPTGYLAGKPTIELKFKSKTEPAFISKGTSKVFDEFSFPLAGETSFSDSPRSYGFEFKSIEFNSSSFKLPAPSLPKDAIVSKWDFESKPLEEAAVRKAAGFEFKLPKSLPRQMKLAKIIRQEGPIPAYTAVYRAGAYSLSVIMSKDYGIPAIPSGRGVPFTIGKSKALLIPNPHVSNLSFVDAGTQYVLVGNLPPAQLVDVGREIVK